VPLKVAPTTGGTLLARNDANVSEPLVSLNAMVFVENVTLLGFAPHAVVNAANVATVPLFTLSTHPVPLINPAAQELVDRAKNPTATSVARKVVTIFTISPLKHLPPLNYQRPLFV
jgi:hypothetical protein